MRSHLWKVLVVLGGLLGCFFFCFCGRSLRKDADLVKPKQSSFNPFKPIFSCLSPFLPEITMLKFVQTNPRPPNFRTPANSRFRHKYMNTLFFTRTSQKPSKTQQANTSFVAQCLGQCHLSILVDIYAFRKKRYGKVISLHPPLDPAIHTTFYH